MSKNKDVFGIGDIFELKSDHFDKCKNEIKPIYKLINPLEIEIKKTFSENNDGDYNIFKHNIEIEHRISICDFYTKRFNRRCSIDFNPKEEKNINDRLYNENVLSKIRHRINVEEDFDEYFNGINFLTNYNVYCLSNEFVIEEGEIYPDFERYNKDTYIFIVGIKCLDGILLLSFSEFLSYKFLGRIPKNNFEKYEPENFETMEEIHKILIKRIDGIKNQNFSKNHSEKLNIIKEDFLKDIQS